MFFTKVNSLKGEVSIPGDKSISHRAVMFGSLAEGTTEVTNFLQGADCWVLRQEGIFLETLSSPRRRTL